jgi:hypothetical protein
MNGSGVDVDAFLSKARDKIAAVEPLIGAVIVVLLSDPSTVAKVYRLCCVLKVITPDLPGSSSSSSSSSGSDSSSSSSSTSGSSSDGSHKGKGGGGGSQSRVMVRVFDGMQVSELFLAKHTKYRPFMSYTYPLTSSDSLL